VPAQIANGPEIRIEHKRGPPGISRTSATKVTLDKTTRTLRDTGRDMQTKYKEAARGGLADIVIEC